MLPGFPKTKYRQGLPSLAGLCAFATLAMSGCRLTDSSGGAERSNLPGGATTISDASSMAFSTPAPNLKGDALNLHREGDAGFEAKFVASPATVNGGLGPVFNNTSCVACHAGDGRGRPPADQGPLSSILIRLSLPGADEYGGPRPVPGFGGQLQPRALTGREPEARVEIAYRDSAVALADGETVTLRVPTYSLTHPYIPMDAGVLTSPRTAPPVFGLGLLEAVDESSILSRTDEDDRDGDGISGRANYVQDALTGRKALGRFGWKANTPNLLQQSAAAYNNDMGITTWVFPKETCYGQTQGCEVTAAPEVDSATLAAVTFYVRTLAVPARRDISDPTVERGEKLFGNLHCNVCHAPDMKSGTLPGVPEASGQAIHPYTDLLIHDMGDGLADGRPDFLASGNEWRTPPLWGIGLTETVSGHTLFLHDGRARGFEEAILWHGGEGEKSKRDFMRLERSDRDALVRFIQSL
jgi:CxxC motif-containing protein (DUF1111 family)